MKVRKVIFIHHGEPEADLLKREISDTFDIDIKNNIFSLDIGLMKQALLPYPKSRYDLIIFSNSENASYLLFTIRHECDITVPVIFLNSPEEKSSNNNFFLKSIRNWFPKTV